MIIRSYDLDTETGVLEMPAGAEILYLEFRGNHITLWARIDLDKEIIKRGFVACVWGDSGSEPDPVGAHVGSTLAPGTGKVYHVFDQGEIARGSCDD